MSFRRLGKKRLPPVWRKIPRNVRKASVKCCVAWKRRPRLKRGASRRYRPPPPPPPPPPGGGGGIFFFLRGPGGPPPPPPPPPSIWVGPRPRGPAPLPAR